MGYAALSPNTASTLVSAPSGGYITFATWIIDFDRFEGSTVDFYLDFTSASHSGGAYDFRLLLGGTIDTDDGTLLCTDAVSGNATVAESSLSVAKPSGLQMVKLMYDATAAGDVLIRGVTVHVGNSATNGIVCLCSQGTLYCNTGNTVVANFVLEPDALPGTGSLTCVFCFWFGANGYGSNLGVVYQGGTSFAYDGTVVSTGALPSSSGTHYIAASIDRPSSATRLKLCVGNVADETSVSVQYVTLMIFAA